MYVLLDSERNTCLLHFHTDHDIKIFSFISRGFVISVGIESWIVSVFHIVAGVMTISLNINTRFDKMCIQLVLHVIFPLQIYHRARFTPSVNQKQRRDFGIFSHLGIIGAECRGNVHNARTVSSGDIITRNHAESFLRHLNKLIFTILAGKNLLRMSSSIAVNKCRRVSI